LVNVCPPDFKDLVKGALLTGARYGELIRLKVKDFNPNDKTTTIFIAESKSGRPRYVILNAEGATLFEELTAGKRPNDLVFTRHFVKSQSRDSRGQFINGGQGAEAGWNHAQNSYFMKRACEAAGLEYLSFHELRHTYASMLINQGVPLVYVASQLGHADTTMAERHYGHLCADDKAKAILAAMPILGIVEPSKVKKLRIKGA